jgi:hypothetical protein
VPELPFGCHVRSMPVARNKSGCHEPADDASVLDGEAERANTVRRRPSSASRNERASRSTIRRRSFGTTNDCTASTAHVHGFCYAHFRHGRAPASRRARRCRCRIGDQDVGDGLPDGGLSRPRDRRRRVVRHRFTSWLAARAARRTRPLQELDAEGAADQLPGGRRARPHLAPMALRPARAARRDRAAARAETAAVSGKNSGWSEDGAVLTADAPGQPERGVSPEP